MNSKAQVIGDSLAPENVPKSAFKTDIVWPNLLGFLVLHLIGTFGFLYGLQTAKLYTTIWAFAVLYGASMGVTMGAHRLYTHRSYKAVWGLRLALVVLQTIAGQNCMYIWVRDHRQHHKYSDTDADPHNSSRGFFFSHIGWLMMKKHPDVIRLGATIDLSDLKTDPLVMFQKKYYKPMYVVFAMAFPASVPLLWGESMVNSVLICYVFRYILQLNGTWLVNSWAHMYGTRPYNKNLPPVESLFVSTLAFGEGWHNYHHSFPWDYRASEYGMKMNWTTKLIDFCARRGWAFDLKSSPQSMVRRRVEKLGDGSHAVWSSSTEGDSAPVVSTDLDRKRA